MNTRRRELLDGFLDSSKRYMKGNVIDIGGKRQNQRGLFRAPLGQVNSWKYLNIDKTTDPDFCCSAEEVPVRDGSFDTALLCEVIEHLEEPVKVLKECFRILSDGGVLIASVPFLFPFHADPNDYQRWTETKIATELQRSGYTDIDISRMGGLGSVIHDLLLISVNSMRNRTARYIARVCFILAKPILRLLDGAGLLANRSIATGYFVVAKKLQVEVVPGIQTVV